MAVVASLSVAGPSVVEVAVTGALCVEASVLAVVGLVAELCVCDSIPPVDPVPASVSASVPSDPSGLAHASVVDNAATT